MTAYLLPDVAVMRDAKLAKEVLNVVIQPQDHREKTGRLLVEVLGRIFPQLLLISWIFACITFYFLLVGMSTDPCPGVVAGGPDTQLVRDSCIGLMRRDHHLQNEKVVAKAEARAQTTRVRELEGQVKALQAELAGSKVAAMELEKKFFDLSNALQAEREETSRLAKKEVRSCRGGMPGRKGIDPPGLTRRGGGSGGGG